DLVQGIGKGFKDLVGRNREAAGYAFRQIAALDFDFADLGTREGGADFLLDELGGGFTDKHAVVAAYVVDDGFVELVAADAHRPLVYHAAQRNDGDCGRTAADVHHHGAAGIGDGQSGAYGRGHGFFDKIDLACTGTQ